jgi:hypothetical protein
MKSNFDAVFFNGIGAGIVAYSDCTDFIEPVSIDLINETLEPGTKSAMTNIFKHPIEYKGILKHELDTLKTGGKILIFYVGCEKNLFEEKHYFEAWHYIDKDVLFKKYNEKSGRDFRFNKKLGIWK